MILHQLIDYEILRVIWWLLLGVVLIGFAVTGGFDLGTGALLPFVAKTDIERRVVIPGRLNLVDHRLRNGRGEGVLRGSRYNIDWRHFSGMHPRLLAEVDTDLTKGEIHHTSRHALDVGKDVVVEIRPDGHPRTPAVKSA